MSLKSSAPDIVTYNTFLNIAAKAGQSEMAEEVLEGMIKRSFAMTVHSSDALARQDGPSLKVTSLHVIIWTSS